MGDGAIPVVEFDAESATPVVSSVPWKPTTLRHPGMSAGDPFGLRSPESASSVARFLWPAGIRRSVISLQSPVSSATPGGSGKQNTYMSDVTKIGQGDPFCLQSPASRGTRASISSSMCYDF